MFSVLIFDTLRPCFFIKHRFPDSDTKLNNITDDYALLCLKVTLSTNINNVSFQ